MTVGATLPTLKEEIDRKAVDACEAILKRLNAGLINQAQASEAALTLFNALAGLVDKEIMDCICGIQDETKGAHVERHVLLFASNATLIEWEVGSSKVSFASNLQGGKFQLKRIFDFSDDLHPAEAAKEKIEVLKASLKAKGWAEA